MATREYFETLSGNDIWNV